MEGSPCPLIVAFECNHTDLRSLMYARPIVRLVAPAMSTELDRIELRGFPRFGGFSDWSEQATASHLKYLLWLPVLLIAALTAALIWFGSDREAASEPAQPSIVAVEAPESPATVVSPAPAAPTEVPNPSADPPAV